MVREHIIMTMLKPQRRLNHPDLLHTAVIPEYGETDVHSTRAENEIKGKRISVEIPFEPGMLLECPSVRFLGGQRMSKSNYFRYFGWMQRSEE